MTGSVLRMGNLMGNPDPTSRTASPMTCANGQSGAKGSDGAEGPAALQSVPRRQRRLVDRVCRLCDYLRNLKRFGE